MVVYCILSEVCQIIPSVHLLNNSNIMLLGVAKK